MFVDVFSDRTAVSTRECPRAAASGLPEHPQSGHIIPGGRGRRWGHPEDAVGLEGVETRRPDAHQQPVAQQDGQRDQEAARLVALGCSNTTEKAIAATSTSMQILIRGCFFLLFFGTFSDSVVAKSCCLLWPEDNRCRQLKVKLPALAGGVMNRAAPK
ncbi:hypothetical protein Zmor_022492 [Zophobas morio]|uniref:Uncharacterized protein n=1 Tax=Zophobas morio TaxID=2755281 RepID=A0AA38I140_9CUCU|nr:hypothetical protein Zmor_022492 [Zophobas morio]